MVNQEQALPQQEMAENPAHFTHAKQVGFNLEDVILNTNNEEYLFEFWYPANALGNSKVSFSVPTGRIYGALGVNTFRKSIGTHYLSYSSDYVDPPSIDIVRPWFLTIGYGEEVSAKGTLRKSLLPPREPVAFKAPMTSFIAGRVPQGTKPGAKPGHKKHSTSKQPHVSNSEVTKGGSSKVPTGFKIGHLKRKKESNSAMDSNPSQTSAFTLVVAVMHKEDLQATGGPTSLESASGNDASAISTAGADHGIFAPSDSIPQQQGTSNAVKTSEEIKFGAIKLDNLAKHVPNVKVDFKDLNSLEDDPIIVVDDSKEDEEDKNAEIHSTTNDETEEMSASTPPSPRSIQLQELKNQDLLLQSQKNTLETKKRKAKAEITRLKAQPFFPNVGQLNEHLVKSLTTEFSKILSAHDFSISLPTELKDLPSKFDELTEEVKGLKKQVHELEIELPKDLKEILSKLKEFTKTIIIQAKLQTLDALPGLLLNVTKDLNKFAQVLDSVSSKSKDQSVPSACQADTMPAEEEKNTDQATISLLYQR
nr:hypothetical protein [Tanacetum cinerariifolium]